MPITTVALAGELNAPLSTLGVYIDQLVEIDGHDAVMVTAVMVTDDAADAIRAQIATLDRCPECGAPADLDPYDNRSAAVLESEHHAGCEWVLAVLERRERGTAYLSGAAAARALGVDRATVGRWIAGGRLAGYRTPGGRIRVEAGEIERIKGGR